MTESGYYAWRSLLEAFRLADEVRDRPAVIFAYTIKARGLPTQGHPANHSALLTDEQWARLAEQLGADVSDPWAAFPDGTPEAELCRRAASRLRRELVPVAERRAVPADVGRVHLRAASTQQAFGRFFVDLERADPELAKHVVTVSPDVASSTSLGGWINHAGVWNIGDRVDWFADDPQTLMRWRESAHGQHIELGIAEGNLVGLLGELGATWSRAGLPLLPIGALYDPFVNRALEPWSFGIYAGGQSILVGTPSGVTLAPEGGPTSRSSRRRSDSSSRAASLGSRRLDRTSSGRCLQPSGALGTPTAPSAYFRLSTRPIDQALAAVPSDANGRELRRTQVLAGGYPLRRAERAPDVTLVGMGAVMPEVIAAAEELRASGSAVDIVCLTSADLVFRALQARQGLLAGDPAILDSLFPAARSAPIVAVLDGHPHTLAFLSAIRCMPIANLGVSDFGQSGDVPDLYAHFGIDADTIVGAALDLAEDRV